jgi:aspartate racemase
MGEHMHPEISMHTYPLAEYMIAIRSGNWRQVADLMLSSTQKLVKCGADFAISPDNTIHQAFSLVTEESQIPWIHIADAVALQAQKLGLTCLAITGTKYLMTGPVYPDALGQFSLSCKIPIEEQREKIDSIIFNELVYGIIEETSRLYFNKVIQEMKDKGCDGVVLGCTEIPLLVRPDDCPLPTLDSTRLLARLALRKAIEENTE